jgi:hypothetical protein
MADMLMRTPLEPGRALHVLADGSPCLELTHEGRFEPCYVDLDGSGWTDCGDRI